MRRDFKTGGRVGLKQGGAYGPLRGTTAGGVAKAFRGKAGFKESQALQSKILKGTPIRKEYADLKRAHHTKQKILTGRAQRKDLKAKEALAPKYGPYGKQLASQAQHPKSWRRAGKL